MNICFIVAVVFLDSAQKIYFLARGCMLACALTHKWSRATKDAEKQRTRVPVLSREGDGLVVECFGSLYLVQVRGLG